MPTLVIAGSKGGCGKSTLSACLAVEAARTARVGLLDLDPQGSIAGWWQRRNQPNPSLIEDDDILADAQRRVRLGFELIVVDTPPALMTVIEGAIAAADMVLVPCRPSALDVMAIDPAVDLCRMLAKPFAFVLTDAEPRWKATESALAALRAEGRVLAASMTHRAAYLAAMTTGRTGPESADGKGAAACREEIEAIWRETQTLLAPTQRTRARV